MKSVLISIKPKWCELIESGKKTIEVRKTRPNIETPFRCYIYCTQSGKYKNGKSVKNIWLNRGTDRRFIGNGKVIGEFVCDCITPLYNVCTDEWRLLRGGLHEIEKQLVWMACLTEEELREYANGKYCYAWHISDLKIYDKPRELSEFCAWKKCNSCKTSGYESTACMYDEDCKAPAVVTRPPQSWCYVEELPWEE